jgi:hypothetical protein
MSVKAGQSHTAYVVDRPVDPIEDLDQLNRGVGAHVRIAGYDLASGCGEALDGSEVGHDLSPSG